ESSRSSVVVFFFQAEDGIRDLIVTGVQTCALPILRAEGCSGRGTTNQESQRRHLAKRRPSGRSTPTPACSGSRIPTSAAGRMWRSEERRVGKECRSRCAP